MMKWRSRSRTLSLRAAFESLCTSASAGFSKEMIVSVIKIGFVDVSLLGSREDTVVL
jgi:hypothetical protein